MMHVWRKSRAAVAEASGFTRYVARRFIDDGCLMGAGALSYTTLVSLVPLIAIALATFSAFPIFADLRDKLMSLLFDVLVPEVGAEARYWFAYFAGSAAHTTAFGVIALAVTAILLLATIEDQLHAIWRVSTPRPWVQRVLVYWTLMTLGPLLLGASLSLSGYFDALARSTGIDPAKVARVREAWFYSVSNLVPFVLESVALTLVYCLVPNTRVRWRDALAGAIVAAAAIELLKIGFGYYIANWASYRTIYGTLAAIPIFLLWMYISWSAVLFGAVVAASLPQWRLDERMPRLPHHGGRQLGLTLALIGELAAARDSGGSRTTRQLARHLGVTTAAADDHLGPLQRAGFVAATSDGGWVLARSPEAACVADLYRALDLPFAGAWVDSPSDAPWQQRVDPAMRRIALAEGTAMRIPLSLLLDELTGPVAAPTPLRRR